MRTGLAILMALALIAPDLASAAQQHDTHHHVRQRGHGRKGRVNRHPSHQTRQQHGRISYYHPSLAGRKMANGERFEPGSDSAASKTLPLGTRAKVTNLKNGKSATVTVKDRGPAVQGRIMDVSPSTAQELDMKKDGAATAEVTPIGPAAPNQ